MSSRPLARPSRILDVVSAPDVHAALVRRLDFLHAAFLEKSDGMEDVQFVRAGASCNHANWLIGHHLWEKDVLLVEWPDGRPSRSADLDAIYGFGSRPGEPGSVPDCAELRRRIAASHDAMLAGLTPANLTQPCRAAPPVFPTRLDCALHFVHDASYHLGQLDHVRKLVRPAP
jgi:hypothetical protein